MGGQVVNIRKVQETAGLSTLKARPTEIDPKAGYIIVEVSLAKSDSSRKLYNTTAQLKVPLSDLLAIPGIAAGLPTSATGLLPGSLWNDGGDLKVT